MSRAASDVSGDWVAYKQPDGLWTVRNRQTGLRIAADLAEPDAKMIAKFPAMRKALENCLEFLEHSGNQRAVLSGKFSTPSGRYDWFQKVKTEARALLTAPVPAPLEKFRATVACPKATGPDSQCAADVLVTLLVERSHEEDGWQTDWTLEEWDASCGHPLIGEPEQDALYTQARAALALKDEALGR